MQRCLIIQTAFLGDVVLALPVGQALRAQYPGAELEWLVRKGNEGLLANHPAANRVWVWDKGTKYRSLLELRRMLRARRYDRVVNLHRFASSGWLVWQLRAKEKIGFSKNPFAWAYTRRLPHHLGRLTEAHPPHEVQRNLSLLPEWDPAQPPLRPQLYPSAQDARRVADLLAPLRGQPYVVVAPTSVWYTKQWPLAQWAACIGALPPELAVVLVGAPTDRPAVAPLVEALAAAPVRAYINAVGELSLLQTAALMAGARRVLANDSAPLHLASAVNAPTTAVFCSTVPQFGFGPLADDRAVVEVAPPLACRPCGLHGKRTCPEGHFGCAWGIDPQVVAKTVA